MIGIDPGSYVAGYTVLRTFPNIEYIQCGVLKLPKARPLNERLGLLIDDLAELVDEFGPETLAIERAYFGEHPRAAIVLSETRGAIKGFALARRIRVVEFAPSTVKRAATGRGNATKSEVRAATMRRFGLKRPPPLDASDSMAVALCGALLIRSS